MWKSLFSTFGARKLYKTQKSLIASDAKRADGAREEYSRRGRCTRERSASRRKGKRNNTRGERTRTAETRVINTVAVAEHSGALNGAHREYSFIIQLNKRSGADARCADARGARSNKKREHAPENRTRVLKS